MKNAPIRIILVDDHKKVRDSWNIFLENDPRFRVVSICANGQEAIEMAQELVPDIMLIDLNMRPMNGFTVTERIVRIIPSIKIIGISVYSQPKYAVKLMELGARGFLTKTSSLEEIKHGIIEVDKGEFYICEEIKRHMPPLD